MTNDEREALIECLDCGRTDGGCDRIMDTPTDDEREAAQDEAKVQFPSSADSQAAFIAGWMKHARRRPVQGEPTDYWGEQRYADMAHAVQPEPTEAMVEAGAREAFFTDDAGGHIRGGYTWDTIPEVGRSNYRTMVRGVLHAALHAAHKEGENRG